MENFYVEAHVYPHEAASANEEHYFRRLEKEALKQEDHDRISSLKKNSFRRKYKEERSQQHN